jgi:hypothetical protein
MNSGIPEMKSFVAGIERDFEAVQAALRLTWSHGHVAYCTSSLGSRSLRFSSQEWIGLRRKETRASIIVAQPHKASLAIPSPDSLSSDTLGGCQFFCREQTPRTQASIPIGKPMISTELGDMHTLKAHPIKGGVAVLI